MYRYVRRTVVRKDYPLSNISGIPGGYNASKSVSYDRRGILTVLVKSIHTIRQIGVSEICHIRRIVRVY